MLIQALFCARNLDKALVGHARFMLVMPKDSSIEFQDSPDFDEVILLPMRNLRRSFG